MMNYFHAQHWPLEYPIFWPQASASTLQSFSPVSMTIHFKTDHKVDLNKFFTDLSI